MQKLHRVGKFFNEWWADPLPPPSPPPPKKRKYHTEKESLTKKHKKVLLNLRKINFKILVVYWSLINAGHYHGTTSSFPGWAQLVSPGKHSLGD